MSSAEALQILIVEDNADARETLQLLLQLEGYQVTAADSGEQAVEQAATTRFDVAMVDIGLPDVDGYEVARRVRAKRGKDIFLVALTGYGQAEDRKRALEAGFDAHLVKPVDPDDLLKVLPGRS
jgi:CheY-like chemotaxis protein